MPMTTPTPQHPSAPGPAQMLSKVPEITIWFWIIKILCTTVGETFADWINMALGVGLTITAVLFTVVTAVILTVQMRLRRYLPAPYWLTVVATSVTGTLYTDILTDQLGVPLWISSAVFAAALIIVFAIWHSKEHTLSIHSIISTPREAFYWLAVLVTFALGTALGDWTLELTGWGPGPSILLPASLIAVTAILWRFGLGPVLAFWVSYILTRPLGANIGDFLGLSKAEQGLGLGTLATSILFLAVIAAVVIYLTISRTDVTENRRTHTEAAALTSPHAESSAHPIPPVSATRRKVTAGALAVTGLATIALLTFTGLQPHQSALADEGPAPSCSSDGPAVSTAAQAKTAAQAHFPAADNAQFRTITSEAKTLVAAGDQKGALVKAKELETAWDQAQPRLQSKDCSTWTFIDRRIDPVLSSVRAAHPDQAAEQQAITDLLASLPPK